MILSSISNIKMIQNKNATMKAKTELQKPVNSLYLCVYAVGCIPILGLSFCMTLSLAKLIKISKITKQNPAEVSFV